MAEKRRSMRMSAAKAVVEVSLLTAAVYAIGELRSCSSSSPAPTRTGTSMVASPTVSRSDTHTIEQLRINAARDFSRLVNQCEEIGTLRTAGDILRGYGVVALGSILEGKTGIYKPTFPFEVQQSPAGAPTAQGLANEKRAIRIEFGSMLQTTSDATVLNQLSEGSLGASNLGEFNAKVIRQSSGPYEKGAMYAVGGGLVALSAYKLLRKKSTVS